VVASLVFLGCAERAIVFQAPSSEAGASPFGEDPFDAAAADSGPTPLRAADAFTHVVAPVGEDAAQDDGTAVERVDEARAGGCAPDPGVEGYWSDLTKLGDRRALRFILVESRPAPPSLGNNVLTLRIVTSDSASLAGDSKPFRGDLRARLTMPDHGHPTTV